MTGAGADGTAGTMAGGGRLAWAGNGVAAGNIRGDGSGCAAGRSGVRAGPMRSGAGMAAVMTGALAVGGIGLAQAVNARTTETTNQGPMRGRLDS